MTEAESSNVDVDLPRIEKALFLGCVIPARIPFVEKSAKVVCADLNIHLTPMLGAACCPEPIGIKGVSEKTWVTLGARNITVAEDMGATDIMGLCSGCVLSLKYSNNALKQDVHLKDEVNESLETVNRSFKGSISTVRHFAHVLYDEIGVEKLKALVKKQLTGLNVAIHYGCHFLRPSELHQIDDPFFPTKLDEIVRVLGAESVEYSEKMLCCGTGVAMADDDIPLKMNRRKYKSMQDAGANCIMVVCPACYQRLENAQRDVKKMFGETYEFPVFYITDLIALALGHAPEEIGLKFHRPSPKNLLAELGIE
ncbi:MAG TPA: heterodisulfide reductase-related iron-sulfur binding cluster [Candidatus Lokiarchaeia archaeon]|nr:heterodisulfide reductase-related iron-sulfur binding cluster [Candidatus Lokiarchaeia archaeon]